MAGAKTAGWVQFEAAEEEFLDARDQIAQATPNADAAISIIALALGQLSGALEDSIQELYERMQRLQQKIDRIEEKVGSLPKK